METFCKLEFFFGHACVSVCVNVCLCVEYRCTHAITQVWGLRAISAVSPYPLSCLRQGPLFSVVCTRLVVL